MGNKRILVSAIIPVYNVEKYLRECLQSVVNQTLEDIEIICIDDGSTDESLNILYEYAEKDSRITVLTQNNQYAGAARNAGLDVAKGEYVHFLDSDDYLTLNAYETLYHKAIRFNADMVKCKFYRIDEKTGEHQENKWNNFPGFEAEDFERIVTFEKEAEKFLKVDVVPWNGVYKREFLIENGIRYNNLICVNDRSFYNAVSINSKRSVFIEDYLVYHRVNIGSSLVGKRAKHFECHFASYWIVKKQSEHLKPELQAAIQYVELKDIFAWYKKFRASEYGEHIAEQMRGFLTEVDIGNILKYCDQIVWLPLWAQLLDKKINGLMFEEDAKKAKREKEDLKKKLKATTEKLNRISQSRSYRIGRFITFVPRKIRGGIRCYKQHGMKYTLKRVLIHLRILNDTKKKNFKKSFTLENCLAFLKKKAKGGVKCYKDHGLVYTSKRLLVHLHLLKDDAKCKVVKNEYEEHKKNFEENKRIYEENKKILEEMKRLVKSQEQAKEIVQPEKKAVLKNQGIKRDYDYYNSLAPEKYEEELKIWYKEKKKEDLDLENPRTFNEKIQWIKLYDNTPLKTRLADKYLVREWIEEKLGEEYLIPLLGVWDHFDEIDFDKLPDQFVLKSNHGSGWNIIVKNKNELNMQEAKEKFDLWMNKNFAFAFGFQLHYMNIPRKIVAEKYMADLDGDIYDYRFFCFNGVPKYVWVDIGSGTRNHKRNIYDMDWNQQNYKVNYPFIDPAPQKPNTFEEMVTCAKKLCEGFAMVRVDFYSVNDKVYFGEMTFTPQSGTGKWDEYEQNLMYGELITLPDKKPYPQRMY